MTSLVKLAVSAAAIAIGGFIFAKTRKSTVSKPSKSSGSKHVQFSISHEQKRNASVKATIAVDLDEVLGQFLPAVINYHNEQYNSKLALTDFHSYNFWEVWGGSAAEAAVKVEAFFESKHFEDIPVIDGAFEVLDSLKHKFDFVLVTSRQSKIEHVTKRWLESHYPGVFKGVYSGNHFGAGKKISKPEMCVKAGASMLIDDNLHYCRECSEVLHQVVLFDLHGTYKWNKHHHTEPLPANVVRLHTWEHVRQHLEQFHSKLGS